MPHPHCGHGDRTAPFHNSLQSDYFGFLRQVKAPSVIGEGFFVDSADANDFDTKAEQQALGVAYAKGVLAYLDITYKGGTSSALATCRAKVKSKYGFSDETMNYLANYKHAEALLKRLSE